MKKLYFLLVVLPLWSHAQNHHSLFHTVKDRFTDIETRQLVKPIIYQKDKASAVLFDFNESQGFRILDLTVIDKDFGCTSDRDHEVYFVFKDGSKFKAYNSETGCKGFVFIYMKNGPAINEGLPEILLRSEISAVKIVTSSGSVEFDIPIQVGIKIKAAAEEFYGVNKSTTGGIIDSLASPKRSPVKLAPVHG